MIYVRNLNKSYGKREVLKNISFTLKKRSLCGLMGKNGVGKTTLIKSILKRVKYGGNVALDIEDKDIYFISDSPHLYEYLSGHEYVCFVLEIKGKSHPDKKLVSELFDLFDLSSSDQNSLIKNYSFGMRRKVALAAGFLLNPPLMILDEPTAGLDAASIVILKKLIRESSLNGMTFLIASHLMDFIINLCDSLIILNEKKIVYNEQCLENEKRDLSELYLNIIGDNLEKRIQEVSQIVSKNTR